MSELSTFVIIQEGRAFAPVRITSEGLLLGRARECDLQLNDNSIPLALGGIKEVEGRFYFLRNEPSPFDEPEPEQIQINGRTVRSEEALASGDVLTINSYRILVGIENSALVLRVSYPDPTSSSVPSSGGSVVTQASVEPDETRGPSADHANPAGTNDVVRQWLDRRIWRDQRKLTPQNFLEPGPQKYERGTEFNWAPTKDLVPQWPVSLLVYCLLLVIVVAIAALKFWPSLFFSPGPLSTAHTMASLSLSPAVADSPVGDSCWSCHSVRQSIATDCEKCHQSVGFQASVTIEHQAAGITCVDCHAEHQGSDFSPKASALASCTNCHNDNNHEKFNGKSVRTPHGGTFGYPFSQGKWTWKGLTEEALRSKPDIADRRLPDDTDRQWRSKMFHAIHLYRIKTVQNIRGIEDGVLSCSSCHNSFGDQLDRKTPGQLCSKCHVEYIVGVAGQSEVAVQKPNCVSCHVQHYFDVYRWGDLLTESAQSKRKLAVDKRFVDAVNQSALRE